MKKTLAIRALKHLSLKIGSLWLEPNGFGNPLALGATPDVVAVDRATKLIEVYVRAAIAYDAENYMAVIEIATEDEA